MTTAMVRWTQPGCAGTIQDGYRTTRGLAAGPKTPSSAPASGDPPARPAALPRRTPR